MAKPNLAVAAGPPKPPRETPHDRFRRLAVYRMTHLERVVSQIINLFGPGYESTADEKDKIVDSFFKYAHTIKAAAEKVGKSKQGFTF